jgi:hypothetical protein
MLLKKANGDVRRLLRTKMATYQPKKKGGVKELTPFELKLLQIQEQQQDLIRLATVQEYEDLVKAGNQKEADAHRERNQKYFPMKDSKGAFAKWKKALIERAQREQVLASQMKKVEKLRGDIASRTAEMEQQRAIFEGDAVAVRFCLAKEGKEFADKTLDQFQEKLVGETIAHFRYIKEKKKSINKLSQEMEVSAIQSDTDEEDPGIMFVDLNLSSPKSASSH